MKSLIVFLICLLAACGSADDDSKGSGNNGVNGGNNSGGNIGGNNQGGNNGGNVGGNNQGGNNGGNVGGNNQGGNNGNVATDCQSRCVVVAESCGAPTHRAGVFCEDEICNRRPSGSSMVCLEQTACNVLLPFFSDPDGVLCGIDFSDPGVENNENNENNQNNENNLNNGNGNNENNEVCIELDDTGCNALNSPNTCCDENAVCFGNGNQAGETICCVPIDGACESNSDCCNDDAPTFGTICLGNTCQFPI